MNIGATLTVMTHTCGCGARVEREAIPTVVPPAGGQTLGNLHAQNSLHFECDGCCAGEDG